MAFEKRVLEILSETINVVVVHLSQEAYILLVVFSDVFGLKVVFALCEEC